MILKIFKKKFFLSAFIIAAVFVLGIARVHHYIHSPDVLFLVDRAGAYWIKQDTAFDLEAKKTGEYGNIFQSTFDLSQPVPKARFTVQALKRFQLFLDGVFIFSSPDSFDQWKSVYNVEIPFPLAKGPHEVTIYVQSENTHPAVIVYSDSLPVKSNPGWRVSENGKTWEQAVATSTIRLPAITNQLPSSWKALVYVFPYLAVVFMVTFFMSFFGHALKNNFEFLCEPSAVRWMMLVLWGGLSLNNLFKLNFQVGVEGWGHMEYLEYILSKGALPLAPDGWQMFQPPLNYVLSAPVYAFLNHWFDWPTVVKMMAGMAVLCGLLQIEMVYRIARAIFMERKDLQNIAVVTGAMLPVHTYSCQYFGNEPLLGILLSFLIFLIWPFVSAQQVRPEMKTFVLIGVVWGLALLTKMTAILMAPVILIVLSAHAFRMNLPVKMVLKNILIVFGLAMAISGWYYLRNYIALGNPFAGPLDHQRFIQWWQDPGYRTWEQVLSFGPSLLYPVYSGVGSFGDAVYSTFWLDGFNSGMSDFVPWNIHWMTAGALLALIPSALILTGLIRVALKKESVYRDAVLFSCGAILLFLAGMMDRFLNCSFYSAARSMYLLSLVPCFAILVAVGMKPFSQKRIVRSLVWGLFSCWVFAAWSAYLVLYPQ